MNCEKCIYSATNETMKELGCAVNLEQGVDMMFCRRYPPQTFIVGKGVMQINVAVKKEGWCGECQAKSLSVS